MVHNNELKQAFASSEKLIRLTREAGELIFDRRQSMSGLVKFSPNPQFIAKMEDSLLEVKEIPLESLTFSGFHKQNWEGSPIYSHRPYELLWLKFYLANINRKYIAYLEQHGFSKGEMEEIWHLADVRVPISYLKRILPVLKANVSPKISLKELADCYQFSVSPELIGSLASASISNLSANQLINLATSEIEPRYIDRLDKMPIGPLTDTLLLLLYQQGVTPDFIQLAQEQGYKGLGANDYLKLKMTAWKGTLISKDKLVSGPNANIYKRSKQVEPFYKLVASGNIRIVLIKDTVDEVSIWGQANMLDKVQVKVKDGVLSVSPKFGFKSTHIFDVVISYTNLVELDLVLIFLSWSFLK